MAAHQAPPSLGFSRQEHWSGLPFPSPVCESEVPQPCLCDPMDCSLPGCATHGIFLTRVLEWGAIASLNLCLGHIKNNLKPENGEIIIKWFGIEKPNLVAFIIKPKLSCVLGIRHTRFGTLSYFLALWSWTNLWLSPQDSFLTLDKLNI